jgi:hypothetical protein
VPRSCPGASPSLCTHSVRRIMGRVLALSLMLALLCASMLFNHVFVLNLGVCRHRRCDRLRQRGWVSPCVEFCTARGAQPPASSRSPPATTCGPLRCSSACHTHAGAESRPRACTGTHACSYLSVSGIRILCPCTHPFCVQTQWCASARSFTHACVQQQGLFPLAHTHTACRIRCVQ